MISKSISQQKNMGKKSNRNRNRCYVRNYERDCKFGFFDECECENDSEMINVENIDHLTQSSPKVHFEISNNGDIEQKTTGIHNSPPRIESSPTKFLMYLGTSRATCFECHKFLHQDEINMNCVCNCGIVEYFKKTFKNPRISRWCCFGCDSNYYCEKHLHKKKVPCEELAREHRELSLTKIVKDPNVKGSILWIFQKQKQIVTKTNRYKND